MFKRSRRKIVAAILSVLVLLLLGTFGIIYLASYAEMTSENRRLLEQYVESYALNEEPKTERADAGKTPPAPGERPVKPPMLELSTFYSVAVSEDGTVLKVDTADVSTLSEDALTALAVSAIERGTDEGVEQHLIYRVAEKDDYTLVAFLDNTVVLESAGTLINYTLIFGGAALIVLFFLARYLAGRIVAPLEESYRQQKQFVSDAGHELKTPVAVINANLDLLSREIGENQWLSNIQYENERMSALVLQLLELARAENVEPQMAATDLSRLTCGEALPFESVAYENGVTLSSEIADDIFVDGNGVQLKQLVSILLDNALRHSRRGGDVSITLRKDKKHAVLSVVNEGEEIPPEQRKHLFERFYRTDAARTGENGNYGLGLAIAKAITASHKGSIDVQCHDHRVEFLVRLPLRR